MLDIMLANGKSGFSSGETAALFGPYRHHHVEFHDQSAAADGLQWQELLGAGPDELYQQIFASDASIARIIDSSKDPFWIQARTRALARQGIPVRYALLWKTPAKYVESRKKRGRASGWRRAWSNYYKLSFRLVPKWRSVSYHSLVALPETLQRLYAYLDVPYFDGKERFCEGSYQTLFGNSAARIHLFDPNTDRYEEYGTELQSIDEAYENETENEDQAENESHRKIYFKSPQAKDDVSKHDRTITNIVEVLRTNNVSDPAAGCPSDPVVPDSVKVSPVRVWATRLKKKLTSTAFTMTRS